MLAPDEAIVLAGGFGTRLAEVVADIPKPMAPVAGRPFLRYILDSLAECGMRRVVIADGYRREVIEGYFGKSYRGVEIVYSSEETPLFTGGAIKAALERIEGAHAYVLNGDTYADMDFERAFDMLIECGADVVMGAVRVEDTARYGRVTMDENGLVLHISEKGESGPGFINAGVYLIGKDALGGMPDAFSFERDYLIPRASKGKVYAMVTEGFFIDIGIPEDYESAQIALSPHVKRWKLAMFDRDGTINVDTGHLFEPEKLKVIPDMALLIARYNEDSDYKVVVVTNQAGIAKGLYSETDMRRLHECLQEKLSVYGAHIDAFYFCPHHPDITGACACRKPAPGMLEHAMHDFDAEPRDCIMYGDAESDMLAARAAGVDAVLVDEGFFDNCIRHGFEDGGPYER